MAYNRNRDGMYGGAAWGFVMDVEIALANGIVHVGRRMPEVREAMVEALFAIRRYQWVGPDSRKCGRNGTAR